jgi:hypothetical protein
MKTSLTTTLATKFRAFARHTPLHDALLFMCGPTNAVMLANSTWESTVHEAAKHPVSSPGDSRMLFGRLLQYDLLLRDLLRHNYQFTYVDKRSHLSPRTA